MCRVFGTFWVLCEPLPHLRRDWAHPWQICTTISAAGPVPTFCQHRRFPAVRRARRVCLYPPYCVSKPVCDWAQVGKARGTRLVCCEQDEAVAFLLDLNTHPVKKVQPPPAGTRHCWIPHPRTRTRRRAPLPHTRTGTRTNTHTHTHTRTHARTRMRIVNMSRTCARAASTGTGTVMRAHRRSSGRRPRGRSSRWQSSASRC